MRERFAGLLHRAGAIEAFMHVRKRLPIPTISVVTYHHVADHEPGYPYDPQVADATPQEFRRQMEWLAHYCTPISVDELIGALDGRALPRNPVMVTFDDGYRTCHDVAMPILRSVGVPATFFVSTKFVEQRRLYWWERIALVLSLARKNVTQITYPSAMELDRRDPTLRGRLVDLVKETVGIDEDAFNDNLARAFGVEWNLTIESQYADGLIMTWDHVRALAANGMDVESHGRWHRILQTLDRDSLVDEIAGSKRDLEAQLGRPVRAMAYPVGRRINHDHRIREELERAGYRVGFSNTSGATTLWPGAVRGILPVDPFDLRRVATDRDMSHAMFTAQVAVPRFGYVSKRVR